MNNSEHNDAFNQAYQVCMTCLARREYSRLELEHQLKKKGITDEIVLTCLDYLVEKKFQSDLRYTDMLLNARINQKYGPTKIKIELQQKGISNDIIDNFVDEKDKHWLENAIILAEKKCRGLVEKPDHKTLDKIRRYLAGRGYNFEIINQAIKSSSINP